MAVDRALWWSVWWPWVVLWVVTALALAAALGVGLWTWRSRRRFTPSREVPGLTIYLHEKSVMDLYQVGRYGDAMTKEVVDRVGVTKDGKIALKGLDLGVEGARTSGREVVKTYIEQYEPIAVVGVLLDALEAASGVVHVDLRDLSVRRNTALEQHLEQHQKHAGVVRLRRIDSYVSVKGVFRVTSDGDGTTVFLAAFGDPDDPESGPQVRVECYNAGLRDDAVPEGGFQARCLGKVQAWKADDQHLVIRPIAMFQ
ncbi:hypothetical protein IOD16_06520 [Saccharothrix sp. 6-C]|uniref:Uncharacterized protein n=1 Tax=Saccharothrix texasensis TaxID=103734 RepID=A0A3N1H4M7_9PSEU|nr:MULTISPECIES: hypothetical protein [Saccharothrix]QQQ78125.1 hypothetical protein IOD16_06520 [Saccharothrix sp. 6-C]ROP37366.1 hypothetical protein EDD40_2678 [Saccharothrix texasensis]